MMKLKAARWFTGFMSGLFLVSAIPVTAAETTNQVKETTVTVNLSMEQGNFYAVPPQDFKISSMLSDTYGYVDQVENGVSALDCLIAIHQNLFGEAFLPETKNDFLEVNESGFIQRMMGEQTGSVGFTVNGMMPNDGVLNETYGTYTGLTLNQTKMNDHDVAQFFIYSPDGYYGEIYTNFVKDTEHVTEITAEEDKQLSLSVKGYSFMYEGLNKEIKWKPVKSVRVCTLETEGEMAGQLVPIEGAVTDDKGNVQLCFDKMGTYYIGVTSNPENLTYIVPQICKVVVEKNKDRETALEMEKRIAALNVQTLEDKAAVEEVRKAYDALTADQKKYVTNLSELEKAEAKIAELEAKDEWIQEWNGKWWYRHKDGSCTKNAWEEIDGKWYYFDGQGWMKNGWIDDHGIWYYTDASGALVTDWKELGGKWYYFNASGAMTIGWKELGGKWYYFDGSGAMSTGWAELGGKWYYFDGSGAMSTGWAELGGKWYYFDGSGAMAANQWVGNCYVNASGMWVQL